MDLWEMMARADDTQVLIDLVKLIHNGYSKRLRLSGCSCDKDDEGINAVLVLKKASHSSGDELRGRFVMA